MNHTASAIAHRYLAAWNDCDAANRRAKVATLFSSDATYLDPLMEGRGVDGIDRMIGAAQEHFPGHVFTLHGTPDAHHDVVRFSWTLAQPGEPPVAGGTDIARLDPHGRLVEVTGFLDN